VTPSFIRPTHASEHAHGKLPVNIIKSGNGIYIKNQQGTELLDAFAGLYCVNVGYGRTEIADAIYEQAKKIAYYHTYVGHSNEAIIELSRRIIDWAPDGMRKVYYGLSGLMQTKRKSNWCVIIRIFLAISPKRKLFHETGDTTVRVLPQEV